MEAPVEKKASVWETLRSKNPLLFAIILVVIAGSCNYLGTGFLTPAFDTVGGVQVAWVRLTITLAALVLAPFIGLFFGQFPSVLEVVGLLIVSASIVLTALSGVQDENDDDKAVETTKTANTPTPSKGE